MHLRFKSSFIAVVLAGTSDGWPKAEGEPGSGKTPARLRRAILRGARRARKGGEMVGILERDGGDGADAFPLKADRYPRALAAATAPTCMVNGVETEFVECTGDGAECKQACLDACAGVDDCSCCVGEVQIDFYYDACNGFQGKVCPDGSCSGVYACYGAEIGYVVDGCRGGEACNGAAQSGYIKEISSSCNANYACNYAAEDGKIQEITSSCNAENACAYAARLGGEIQEISSSCNAYEACYYAAYDGGEIQEISSSCNAYEACKTAAREGGYIKRISLSCDGTRACESAARLGGEIQEISSSCNNVQACFDAAFSGGYIKGLSESCNADSACDSAARDGTIPNKMERCCNSVSACKDLAEDSQQDPDPDQCDAAPAPSPSTASPTTGSTTIKNEGVACWAHCGETAGDCAYCGTGQCCRAVDYRNQVAGCELAEHAVGARCGNYRGGGFPSLMNLGLPCIGKCGKQPGDCDHCGIAGQCCRSFDGERCVPGCELAVRDSWMGPGSQCGQFKGATPAHCQ